MRLIFHESSADARFVGITDVGVSGGRVAAATLAPATTAAPLRLPLPAVEVERQSALAVRDTRDFQLVTAVELLSPSNKAGEDRLAYLAKRKELLRAR